MAPKNNPLRLNKLQLRTLALAQVLARDGDLARRDDASGDVILLQIPRPHGDHVHIGQFTVSARDASGFANPGVWRALMRKGLARAGGPGAVTITADGIAYYTGLGDRLADPPPPGE